MKWNGEGRDSQRESRTLLIFADHLADGLSPTDAALRMGHRPSAGPIMLQKIRVRLGQQAC